MKCERCGAPEGRNATLAGGFRAALCNKCMNSWHREVSATEAGKSIRGHDLFLEVVRGGVKIRDDVKLVSACDTIESLVGYELELFDAAEAWFETIESLVGYELELFDAAEAWFERGHRDLRKRLEEQAESVSALMKKHLPRSFTLPGGEKRPF